MLRYKLYFLLAALIIGTPLTGWCQAYKEHPECRIIIDQFNEKLNSMANCETVNDCVHLSFYCPFGCGTAVRRGSEDELHMIVDKFNKLCPGCDYKCSHREFNLKCINSRCTREAGKWR